MSFFYKDIKSHKDKSKPLFVSLHGICESIELLDHLKFPDFAQLSARFNLLRYDARGHGKSQGTMDPSHYTWASQAEDLDKVLMESVDSLSEESRRNVFLHGSSMGTGTVLNFMANPEARESLKHYDIKGLVLSLPPTCWETRITNYFDTLADKVRDYGMEEYVKFLRGLEPNVFCSREYPEYREIVLSSLGNMNASFYEAIIRGAKAADLPPKEEISNIKLPTLILGRVDDEVIHPVSSCNTLENLIKNSKTFIANNREDLDASVEMVADFMNTHSV